MMNKSYKWLMWIVCMSGIGPLASSSFSGEKMKQSSKPKRISAQVVDLGKVQTIYMVPGMATLIEIPSAVTGIRLGNPDQIKYFRPEHPDNEVTLILKESLTKPTNLFILSGKKKYIFDIVPSSGVHQDSIEIVGAFGGAELQEQRAELIDSSESGNEKSK